MHDVGHIDVNDRVLCDLVGNNTLFNTKEG
jgi:hypothetical protein